MREKKLYTCNRRPFCAHAVFSFYRDRSRCGIKSCNPKNQIWDKSRNKWYLSHSCCGIKSGIQTTFRARNCGFVLAARVHPWPSAGARRGQDAGSALLRNEAVHTVLPGPRAVSCLVFFAQSARSCRFTLGWCRRAAQSENQLDTGRFAMKGMASTRPCQ